MPDRKPRQVVASSATKSMAPQPWKMPPLIKIYEALGAIGDERVALVDAGAATVGSSGGDKRYAVAITEREISSNDNASFWRGYLGYPAIAVMIARGMIPADEEAARALRAIPWKELNRRFRNDYAKTLAEVDRVLVERAVDPSRVRAACERILAALVAFAPIRGSKRRPPASH